MAEWMTTRADKERHVSSFLQSSNIRWSGRCKYMAPSQHDKASPEAHAVDLRLNQ